MDGKTALPVWIVFLLIALGIALAVGIALLLTQLDMLQQRSLLPQATLPVLDQEATLAAGEVTIVVIAGEDLQTNTPTLSPSITPQITGNGTPVHTAVPVLIPTCSAAPEGWSAYVIKAGDTAESLAIRYGISIASIVQANCLTIEPLSPGQLIQLPLSTPTPATEVACGAPSGWVQYTVRPGDTLAGLAEQRDTRALLIMNANCLEETKLEPGRIIFLPPLPPMQTMPTATHTKTQAPMHWIPARPSPARPMWLTATATQVTASPTVVPATSTSYPVVIPSSTATNQASLTPLPSATAIDSPTDTPQNTSTPAATADAVPTPSPEPTNPPDPPVPTPTSAIPYPYPGHASFTQPSSTPTPISYP